jgi:mRNA interferase RelE/StbE
VDSHEVRFARSARKETERLPGKIADRVLSSIARLAQSPRPVGCQKLEGEDDFWRIRIGDYRVVYQIDAYSKTVYIRRVRHRRDVYR